MITPKSWIPSDSCISRIKRLSKETGLILVCEVHEHNCKENAHLKYSEDADAKAVTTDVVVFLIVSLKTKDDALLPNNDVVSLSIGKTVAAVVATVKLASNFKSKQKYN